MKIESIWMKLKLGLGGLAAVLCIATPISAAGQAFPQKPVKLVVPFPPGGAVDGIARVLSEGVSQALGQPLVVENMGGAGGSIAARAVSSAKADGYSVLLGTATTHGTNAVAVPNSPDPVNAFSPVILLSTSPWLVVVSDKSPFRSLQDLIEYGRKHPAKLDFGSYGPGSSNHLATELLRVMGRFSAMHVPYRGSAPALMDLMSGRIDFMLDTYATSMPHVKAGKLRVLAVTSAERVAFLPDAPTVAELGVQDYATDTFYGVFAPAKTPAHVVQRLNEAFLEALSRPNVRAQMSTMGLATAGGGPAELGKRVASDVKKWKDLARSENLKLD